MPLTHGSSNVIAAGENISSYQLNSARPHAKDALTCHEKAKEEAVANYLNDALIILTNANNNKLFPRSGSFQERVVKKRFLAGYNDYLVVEYIPSVEDRIWIEENNSNSFAEAQAELGIAAENCIDYSPFFTESFYNLYNEVLRLLPVSSIKITQRSQDEFSLNYNFKPNVNLPAYENILEERSEMLSEWVMKNKPVTNLLAKLQTIMTNEDADYNVSHRPKEQIINISSSSPLLRIILFCLARKAGIQHYSPGIEIGPKYSDLPKPQGAIASLIDVFGSRSRQQATEITEENTPSVSCFVQ